MRLWTCTDHDHHYPVGVASIVIAETEEDARRQLEVMLALAGLNPLDPVFTLQEVDLTVPGVRILCDGEY